MKKRIVFLMSDTGGGHRAAAEAIRYALIERHGEDALETEMIDVYRKMRYPTNKMPEFYPWVVNNAVPLWTLTYRVGDTVPTSRFFAEVAYWSNRNRLRRMVTEHPADLVVCVHSVIARPSMDAYMSFPKRPPFVTVVTDLVTTPFFWYDKRVDRCLVPTQEAYDRGITCGLHHNQLRVTGLPVHPQFNRALTDKDIAREALGWDPLLPTVTLIAGGDGMGQLYEQTKAIVSRGLPCQIAVVAGRNKHLQRKLEQARAQWQHPQPIHVYGFVKEMPRLMAATDFLVTKAGPATISEAAIAGLPMIISDAIPGQEDGNVTLVVENGAGVFAPQPSEVADTLERWISGGPELLAQLSDAARRVAHPDAVWDIADEVWQYAQREFVAT